MDTSNSMTVVRLRQSAAHVRVWITSSEFRGLLAVLLGGGLARAIYRFTSIQNEMGWPGLCAGVLAAILIVFCCLLWVRKRVSGKSRFAIGSVPIWRRVHYWAGSMILPTVFCHTGRRMGGPVEIVLMILLAAIVASGMIGYQLQRWSVIAGNQSHPVKQAAAQNLHYYHSLWPRIHVPLCVALLLLLAVHLAKVIYF